MALSDNRLLEGRGNTQQQSGVAASETIYKGALLNWDSGGHLVAATDSGTDLAFAGISDEKVDNSGGSDGDKECMAIKEGVYLLPAASSLGRSDIGTDVYVSDDEEVDVIGNVTNNIKVGTIVEYDSDSGDVWVRIDPTAV